jgi:hypothetical protein
LPPIHGGWVLVGNISVLFPPHNRRPTQREARPAPADPSRVEATQRTIQTRAAAAQTSGAGQSGRRQPSAASSPCRASPSSRAARSSGKTQPRAASHSGRASPSNKRARSGDAAPASGPQTSTAQVDTAAPAPRAAGFLRTIKPRKTDDV